MTNPSPTANPRPVYHSGQLLTLDDFNAEQSFHVVARQEQTRQLFGPGALSGLAVDVYRPPITTPTPSGQPDPVSLRVAPGEALDVDGRLLPLAGLAQLSTGETAPFDGSGNLLFNLARAPFYVRGQTISLVLSLSFGEVPSPQNAERMLAAPIVTLGPAAQAPPDGVVLARLTIAAPAAPAPPPAGTTPPPDNFTLAVTLQDAQAAPATLAASRLPPIAADQISGQLPATQVSGVLSADQIPALPASKITDWPAITAADLPPIPADKLQGPLTPDQLPPIPADKLQGVLTLDQLPAIPAGKVTDWPAITAAELPPIPADKLQGPLVLDQLPRIPASQIDGLPQPDTGPIALSRLAGPLGTAQVPLLVEILRRLDALEGRHPTIDGRTFAGAQRVSTLMTTAAQAAYRDANGGAACPNDLADILGDGFTFQALVRTNLLTGDNPLGRYVFEDPAAAGGKVLPGAEATAFAISLRNGAPILQMVDAVSGAVDVVSGGTAVAAGAWTLVTCAWRAGTATIQLEDGPAASGPARAWAVADGRFEFAADGLAGFTGDVAWFALWKGALDVQGVAQTPRRAFTADEIAAWPREGLAGYWPMTGLVGDAAPDLTPVADNGTIGPVTANVPGARPQDLVLEQVVDRLQLRWRPGLVAADAYVPGFAGPGGQAVAASLLPAGDPAMGPGALAQGANSSQAVVAGQAYTASVVAQVGGVSLPAVTVGPLTASAVAPPQNLSAVYQSGSSALDLTWTGADAPGGFVVQAWPQDGDPLPDATAAATARTATLNAPALDTPGAWRVRVGARAADGVQTVWSGPPLAVALVRPDKATASSLSWDAQKGMVAAWTPVAGASTYDLRLSDAGGPVANATFEIGGDAAAPTAVVKGPAFAVGQAYDFQVRAVIKSDGVEVYGPWSDTSAASALTVPAIAPVNCVVRQDGAALVLNWSPGTGGLRPYEVRLTDPSGAPVSGVDGVVGSNGAEARFTGSGLVAGGRYIAAAHAVDPQLASDWVAAPEITYAAPTPPALPTAFAGIYLTDTQWWGGYFDPLLIDANGAVSLAGVTLPALFDPAASRLTWDWTDMKDTRTTGNIILSGDGDARAFSGTINPRPQDGPVGFKSTRFTSPFRAEIDFSNQAVQATNASFLPNPGMIYNTQYGGWMLAYNGASFRIVFPVTGAPIDLKLMLYNCTSSLWPRDGFSPVNIQLNATMIKERYDPASAHAGTGADTTNYLRDTFTLPAAALVTGDNTLTFTLQPDAKTRYWIRDLIITS